MNSKPPADISADTSAEGVSERPAEQPAEHPPSVDRLARQLASSSELPHPLLVEAAREAIAAGDPDQAAAIAQRTQAMLVQPVINATGVLLHTNLGRAPLAAPSPASAAQPQPASGPASSPGQLASPGYSNLEFNLATGQRGSRQVAVGQLFAKLCGAQAAMVVNNGAAAVLLALAALAAGRGAVVSRGELVEIGGGFRVPEVMTQSGAKLVEVGTTNRTRVADYANAIARPSADAVLCLKVHQSNYTIEGFSESASLSELAQLGLPVVYDLGSGLLDAACPWLKDGPPDWLVQEPAVRQSLAAGADLVIFSGDKLLGGPQAGIICGRQELVDQCAAHPLARALRPSGQLLAGLQQVALAYLHRDLSQLPFWQLATQPTAALRERIEAVGLGPPVALESVPGGGTLPGVTIESAGICLPGDQSHQLRQHHPAVIARVANDQTYLDFRTILPAQDAQVAEAVHRCTSAPPAS